MDPGPLVREQVAADCLVDQGVAEGVALFVDDQDVRAHRLACGGVQWAGTAGEDRRQKVVPHPHPTDRDEPEHLLRLLGQPLVAGQQEVAQRVGGCVPTAGLLQVEEILDEERDALAALVHALEDRDVGRPSEDRLGEVANLGPGEPIELDPNDAVAALEPGQERAQRVPTGHVVAAVAEHHQDPRARQGAQHELQDPRGRVVGPLAVLDDHERRGAGHRLQGGRHGLVQAVEISALLRW